MRVSAHNALARSHLHRRTGVFRWHLPPDGGFVLLKKEGHAVGGWSI